MLRELGHSSVFASRVMSEPPSVPSHMATLVAPNAATPRGPGVAVAASPSIGTSAVRPRRVRWLIGLAALVAFAGLVVAAVLVVLSLTVAAISTYPAFLVTLVTYLVCTFAYSIKLKHEPVVELVLIAAGFLLRAIAGGTATGIAMSPWFLTVAAFGSLFMAAGKRYSE